MQHKKIGIALLAGLMIGLSAVTGTVAWFTTNDQITNTFTVGKITMAVAETKVGSNPKVFTTEDQTYKVIPGDQIPKDPTVIIKAYSESCYVVVKIENELNRIVPDAVTLHMDSHWQLVPGTNEIYQYIGSTGKLEAVPTSPTDQLLPSVFSYVQVSGEKVTPDTIQKLSGKTIIVKAFAHQSANITPDRALAEAIAYLNK